VAFGLPVKEENRAMKWQLDQNDVGGGWSTSSSTKSGQFSRRLKVTSARLTLTHLPTGLEVRGEVPDGHYSKKEMRKLREELYARLFLVLEEKVGKHLRAPGR
jgi:hypothetical protein